MAFFFNRESRLLLPSGMGGSGGCRGGVTTYADDTPIVSNDYSGDTAGVITAHANTTFQRGFTSGSSAYTEDENGLLIPASTNQQRVQSWGGAKVGALLEPYHQNYINEWMALDTGYIANFQWAYGPTGTTTRTAIASNVTGVDGLRVEIPSPVNGVGHYAKYSYGENNQIATGTRCVISVYAKWHSGSGTHQMSGANSVGGAYMTTRMAAVDTQWRRNVMVFTHVYNSPTYAVSYFAPCVGSYFTGVAPETATVQDVRLAAAQWQVGTGIPLSPCLSVGYQGHCNQDVLTAGPSAWVDSHIHNGRVSLWTRFIMLGNSAEYTGTYTIWRLGGHSLEYIGSTRLLKMTIYDGVPEVYTFATQVPTWSRGDILDIYSAGGNTRVREAKARVIAYGSGTPVVGPTVNCGTGVGTALIAADLSLQLSAAMDAGGTQTLPCMLSWWKAYSTAQGPGWVKPL